MKRWAGLLSLLLAFRCAEPPERGGGRPLGVLLVTLDTTRADHLFCYGREQARTPVLDRLAKEGVLFEQAVAPTPITLPSHASLLTGVAPRVHGIRDNAIFRLADEARLLSEVYRDHGYRTAAFVGSYILDQRFGLNQGFETYSAPRNRGKGAGSHVPERPAAEVVDDALAWLGTIRAGESFFVWLHFYDPHHPYRAPERFARSAATAYDAEIAYCDAELDRVLQVLPRLAGRRELLTAVTADHGESLGEHGESTHGIFVYQSTLHVPLILHGAGLADRAGQRIPDPVSIVDLPLTLLELSGIGAPELPAAAGRSLLPRGGVADAIYFESFMPLHAFRWHPLEGVLWRGQKLIQGARQELYSLDEDPAETNNLAAAQPDLCQRLERRLTEWKEARQPLGWNLERDLSDGDRQALLALGYTAGSVPETGWSDLPDPKARIGDVAKLSNATRWVAKAYELRQVLAASPSKSEEFERLLAKACQSLLEVLEGAPGSPQATVTLATVELLLEDYETAAKLFEQAIVDQPLTPTSHYHLAFCYQKLGREDDAVEWMRRTIWLEPRFFDAYQWLISYYGGNNEYGRAAGWIDRLAETMELNPDEAARVNAWRDTAAKKMRELGQSFVPAPAPGDVEE